MRRKVYTLAVVSILILGCTCTAFSTEKKAVGMSELACEEIDDAQVELANMLLSTRATQKIDADIPAGKTVKDITAYPLEVNDVVSMNLTFSPAEADMDFGLIAPDKKFYSFKGADGTFKENIQVSMTGKYYLAIRNNSNSTVAVMGFVYY